MTFSTDKLSAGGAYTFFCSFPGHSYSMRGKLTINP
ncbi:MAG: plastocyanin/azurin family copper-binding protein [Porticoccaceae bacterium]|nr:plastocyanin/azurin family copper-binding protein [Porticoccaceae bacterium]